MRSDMNWIKCSERMPEEKRYSRYDGTGPEWYASDQVLVWDSMYGASISHTVNGKWHCEHLGGYQGQVCHGIIAWMPIPEFKEEDV